MRQQADPTTVNKIVSALHATATSITAVLLLKHSSWPILEPSQAPGDAQPDKDRERPLDDSRNPLISGRNSLASTLTAWETVYLLYDTCFMVYASRKRNKLNTNAAGLRLVAKESPVILAHHILLASAFLVLQSYIVVGKEKGLWVITAFMLMNSSNPLMHLRWYIRQRTGKPSNAIDVAFLATFAGARFGLVAWILTKYGQYHGLGPVQAYRLLRKECRIGTAMLVGFNGAWWIMLALKVVNRKLKR
ncbi:hypothetical protein BU26DRAFT_512034 [Trematosphaeria pertusa]|uniref:TLC domain-containing protein n=1 Tax=Trematosphaeria pertusa TaxID=390896 RepID=A0A6A6HQY5_9PLEO|nr:uncharacterized protein BU26DRAFT_512034 [Trematosphaeria pertusa]KAF2240555.1 hypothetical protein BU26DRAFT_512034 [Trematosphaeria pertusa]